MDPQWGWTLPKGDSGFCSSLVRIRGRGSLHAVGPDYSRAVVEHYSSAEQDSSLEVLTCYPRVAPRRLFRAEERAGGPALLAPVDQAGAIRRFPLQLIPRERTSTTTPKSCHFVDMWMGVAADPEVARNTLAEQITCFFASSGP